jgi:tRNA nucleotidyltransferase (CCA-adding enzyme)
MKKLLKSLPPGIHDVVCRARTVSGRLQMPAFLVGGFVRDLLIGRRDYDLDIAVEGRGIEFAKSFCEGSRCRLVSHARFGTATVEIEGDRALKVDFASTRRETYPAPAALPVVSLSTLKDDLARRDFTINTLAVGLDSGGFGKLVDPFGGKQDLDKGLVRVLHDRSFIDDPTRILRAVRFEQRFGFRIEPHTLRLLKTAVREGMLLKVQPQRLRDEVLLMMNEEFPERAVIRLARLAGWDFLSPRVTVDASTVRLFRGAREQAGRYGKGCPGRPSARLASMYLAALFSGLRPADALPVCRRFAFDGKDTGIILAYLAALPVAGRKLRAPGMARSGLFRLLDPLPAEAVLLIAAASRSTAVKRRIDEFFGRCRGTRPLLSGHDLRRLGIEPGPAYGRILRTLLDARLEGKVATREDEVEFVSRMRKGKGFT